MASLAPNPTDNYPLEYSVVIPVWNEEENLPLLFPRVTQAMAQLGGSYEIIFVDDGSKDRSFALLREFHERDSRVVALRFTRNFGQHPAVMAGFFHARGRLIITLDSDLQNPPEEIPRLVHILETEGWDVVSGWRENRFDPLSRRLPSLVVNWMIARLTKVKLHDYGCMLRVYRREVIEMLKQCGEMSRFITALVSWLGVSIGEVKVKHAERAHGKSKYHFRRLLRMNMDLLTGFSIVPIQWVSIIGVLFAIFGFITAFCLVIYRLTYGNGPSGMVTFLAFQFIFFGVVLVSLGLIGEYIGRIFIEVQKRPYFIVRETLDSFPVLRGPQFTKSPSSAHNPNLPSFEPFNSQLESSLSNQITSIADGHL